MTRPVVFTRLGGGATTLYEIEMPSLEAAHVRRLDVRELINRSGALAAMLAHLPEQCVLDAPSLTPLTLEALATWLTNDAGHDGASLVIALRDLWHAAHAATADYLRAEPGPSPERRRAGGGTQGGAQAARRLPRRSSSPTSHAGDLSAQLNGEYDVNLARERALARLHATLASIATPVLAACARWRHLVFGRLGTHPTAMLRVAEELDLAGLRLLCVAYMAAHCQAEPSVLVWLAEHITPVAAADVRRAAYPPPPFPVHTAPGAAGAHAARTDSAAGRGHGSRASPRQRPATARARAPDDERAGFEPEADAAVASLLLELGLCPSAQAAQQVPGTSARGGEDVEARGHTTSPASNANTEREAKPIGGQAPPWYPAGRAVSTHLRSPSPRRGERGATLARRGHASSPRRARRATMAPVFGDAAVAAMRVRRTQHLAAEAAADGRRFERILWAEWEEGRRIERRAELRARARRMARVAAVTAAQDASEQGERTTGSVATRSRTPVFCSGGRRGPGAAARSSARHHSSIRHH